MKSLNALFLVLFALATASVGQPTADAGEAPAEDNCLLIPRSCSMGISREALFPNGVVIASVLKGYRVVTHEENVGRARFELYVCDSAAGARWVLTDFVTGTRKQWTQPDSDLFNLGLAKDLPSCKKARRGLPEAIPQ